MVMEETVMGEDTREKLRRIKRVSIFARSICRGLLVITAIVGLCCVVCVIFGVGEIGYGGARFSTAGLNLGLRLALGLMTAAAMGALVKCFYHLHRLFGKYSRGEVFTRECVGQLRRFGVACLLWGVTSFAWILSLAFSVHSEKTFAYGRADAIALGVIILTIAWFMDMAVDLKEENELTI